MLKIKIIECGDTRYILNTPIVIKFERIFEGGALWWYAEGTLGNITPPGYFTGMGKTKEEAIMDVHLDFDVVYRNYALEDDERLTKGAIELKTLLRKYVKVERGNT